MASVSSSRMISGICASSRLMQSALQAPPASVCCLDPRLRIYRFPDGTALRFAQEQITTKAGVRYTQITAADVTELIRKQNQLKAENAKLEKTNKRLKRLLAQMPEIIREEAPLSGGSDKALKLTVPTAPHLHEFPSGPCVGAARGANCVRHADGTELYVRFWQKPDCMEVSLTNNGAVIDRACPAHLNRLLCAGDGRRDPVSVLDTEIAFQQTADHGLVFNDHHAHILLPPVPAD